jgi:hypothetical protein
VTEENAADSFQGFFEQLQIERQADAGAGVEQIPFSPFFNQCAESMLSNKTRSSNIIIAQNGNFGFQNASFFSFGNALSATSFSTFLTI